MELRVDHVTLATSELTAARDRLGELGLETEYGGPHSNGVTHMALLRFDDGSYVELISTIDRSTTSPLWDGQIRTNAGPAAWAARVDDLSSEKKRLAAAGIRSTGPVPMTRSRPDGITLEWELLFPGEASPGATLPFVISDRTPRDLRVQSSASAAAAGLHGVAQVVIGVRAMDRAAELFERAYGWARPLISQNDRLGASLAMFPGTPVVLAEPWTSVPAPPMSLAHSTAPAASTAHSIGWLAERVGDYGDSPAAFLLSVCRGDRASGLPLLPPEPWPGGEVAWLDPELLFGWHVGLLLTS